MFAIKPNFKCISEFTQTPSFVLARFSLYGFCCDSITPGMAMLADA